MADTFTEEQTAAIKSMINDTVNGAVATINKNLKASEKASTEGFAKLLDEKLSALKPPEGGGGGEGGEGGKNGKGKSLELDTLRKQISDAQDAIRAANEKTVKAEQRRREVERTTLVNERLAKAGIADPFMRDLAIAHFDRRGRVAWDGEDEDARVVWNGDDGVAVDFEPGFAAWLKTDEAKRFLPAAGRGGSGSRPGSGARPPEKKQVTYDDVGRYVLDVAAVGGNGTPVE